VFYTNLNKFSYIPSLVGEGGDEENLNKNLLGLVLFLDCTSGVGVIRWPNQFAQLLTIGGLLAIELEKQYYGRYKH
jgi:hypothetical protein